MDYISAIAKAFVTFIENFDFISVVESLTEVDWSGVKDALVSVVESVINAVG